jgi:sarcosine oxidase
VEQVIVVGGGVIGCATAYALACRGVPVTVVERFAVGHDRGSSHGPSRIIRLTYESTDYIALARASLAAWTALADASGERLVVPCGGVDFGPPDALYMAEMRASMTLAGVPFEEVDGAQIAGRYPQLSPPEGATGFFQADYAMLAADRCVAALASAARAAGAAFREDERVLALEPDGTGVTVTTDRGALHGSAAVLAAGSWVGPLLAGVGLPLPLTVLREQLAFFEPEDPARFQPGVFPLVIQRFPNTTMLGSMFPILGTPAGVKLMIDRIGPAIDPDEPPHGTDEAIQKRLLETTFRSLRGLTGRVNAIVQCRYTMTPDEHFILDRHPEHPQIIVASACSGHGFKFAPVIGDVLADLATTGTTCHDITRFRVDRPALTHHWELGHV